MRVSAFNSGNSLSIVAAISKGFYNIHNSFDSVVTIFPGILFIINISKIFKVVVYDYVQNILSPGFIALERK